MFEYVIYTYIIADMMIIMLTDFTVQHYVEYRFCEAVSIKILYEVFRHSMVSMVCAGQTLYAIGNFYQETLTVFPLYFPFLLSIKSSRKIIPHKRNISME